MNMFLATETRNTQKKIFETLCAFCVSVAISCQRRNLLVSTHWGKVRISIFLFFLLPFSCFAQKTRIWIDTDIMIGKFRRDVDDGLALMMALADTDLQIAGISLVQDVDHGEKVTKKLLGWYAPEQDIPVFRGATDSSGFGIRNDAVNALESALEKGPLTIVALGPLTNVATLMKLRPDLHSNIKAITTCAGRRPGMLFNPGSGKVRFSDFNFDLAPWTTQVLLDSEVPLLLAGYDCSDSLFIERKDIIHLKKSEHPGDRWLFRKLKSWGNLWSVFIGSKKGFIPFDCSTLGAMLYANEFEIDPSIPAFIEVAENDSKHTVSTPTKPYLFVDKNREGKIVSYCHYTSPEFKKRLLRALRHPDYP